MRWSACFVVAEKWQDAELHIISEVTGWQYIILVIIRISLNTSRKILKKSPSSSANKQQSLKRIAIVNVIV